MAVEHAPGTAAAAPERSRNWAFRWACCWPPASQHS